MKKIAFSGFMASILMVTGAAFAAGETNTASLTTKGYVDKGLRDLYSAVGSKLGSGANGYDIDAKTLKVGGADVLTSAAIANKADVGNSLASYGILDAYTKTEANAAFDSAGTAEAAQSAIVEKLGSGATGYDIDAKTLKVGGADVLTSVAIADKADKATTLAGYNIADAYTKDEADLAFDAAGTGATAAAEAQSAIIEKLGSGATGYDIDAKTLKVGGQPVLTSADVAVYTGTGGITVDANHQIALDTTGLDSTAMYVFQSGTWSELEVNETFPTNFNFAGE